MKSKSVWLLTATLIMLATFAGWSVYAQSKTDSTVRKAAWEYKIVYKFMTEQELNEFGAQGWELVQYDPGLRGGDSSTSESFLFKRAK